jgi:YfiH family protein
MNPDAIGWVGPDWRMPGVRVVSTLRYGGMSTGAYASLNLARHVGDQPVAVTGNRRLLRGFARLPAEPLWLNQVHGNKVLRHDGAAGTPTADASVSIERGRVCAVMTADCLPIALADENGACVGVVHAGWRGLLSGVIAATVAALPCRSRQLLAWLGPAISQAAFEVGAEVRDAFVTRSADFEPAFAPNERGRFQADLYALARTELEALGLTEISGGHWCTFGEPDRFFSFRRDGRCGRMATLAWLE